jgi:two-component system cell cycle sensor histidine kinase/response regulator CckA
MSATQILIVEDERLVATALQNELAQFGYGVVGIASTAKDAVDKAIAAKPDLVLMDINLKGNSDGIDAALEIHKRCGIPVVYLSAFSDPQTVARASQTGAFGYLLKPYEEQELRTTIEIVLAKHRAEKELDEARRWLAAIHAGIDDAILAVDPEMRIRFINPAAQTLVGVRREDATGMHLKDFCRLQDSEGQFSIDRLAFRAIGEGRPVELPSGLSAVSTDKHQTPVEGSFSAIHDSRGEFLGMALTLRNISARLEIERLRHHEEERMRRVQKMDAVSRVVGGLSQHLNNLLTVILGNTSLALATLPEESESWASFHEVESAAQTASQIVQRMILFSTLPGRPSSQIQPSDPNELVAMFSESARYQLDDRISVDFAPQAGAWQIAVDELLFGQALLELAMNAQDAMPTAGQLKLALENVTRTKSALSSHPGGYAGQFVRLRVSDNGCGIKSALRDQIFEPCVTTKTTGTAVGLGLSLVRAIMEQHHGWIEFDSQASSGTQFDLYFPRYGAESAAPRKARSSEPSSESTPAILLADADPLVRDVGRRILESEGYKVLLAEDGAQAVAIYQREPDRIDLAILDLNLPRLSAYAVLERFVEMNPSVKVLFSGGYLMEDLTGSQGQTLGVITKPYHQSELVEMVRRSLSTASILVT